MYTQQFFVEGLGCASYIVGCEAKGVAAIVDPDREVQKYLDVASSFPPNPVTTNPVPSAPKFASRSPVSVYRAMAN